MKSDSYKIQDATHKEIIRLYKILEAKSEGEIIDFAIFTCSAMLDVLPEIYIDRVIMKSIQIMRDYYDSPVGINNQ